MIIQSIRLKNIKSYGAGPDGEGVTICFESGVNRVAGRNGHGKTTLIESVGYALFLTEPQFEENFQTETYFLSHGTKEGEIDVTFSCDGQSYRIERSVGKQSKRRSKVVQLSDQSICAEGDKEVSDFLCRLLKFPDAGHLSEVFCKLVGVKQGRLAWPFDSKPAEAKRYFEPLLEVDVFRDCFDRLKGAVDNFKEQKNEQLNNQAAIKERMQERSNSPETLASAGQKVEATAAALEAANKDRAAALKTKDQLNAKGKLVGECQAAVKSATQKNAHAKELGDVAQVQLAESKAAVTVLATNTAAHSAHIEAVQSLVRLEQQREKRDDFKQQRDSAEAGRKDREAKSTAARDQAKVFSGQCSSKQKEHDDLAGKMAPLKEKLESTENYFRKSTEEADTAKSHRDTIRGWVDGLKGLTRTQKRNSDTVSRLAKAIAGWDDTKLKAADKTEGDAAKGLKSLQNKLAKAEQSLTTLGEQLKEISGGVCPFLKEKCRQFDPAKVRADLEKQSAAVAELRKEVEKSGDAHIQAGEKLRELRASQAQIVAMTTELTGSIENYGEGMVGLTPEEVEESITWIKSWERRLPAMPKIFKVSVTDTNPAAVLKLQQQLETFLTEAEAWWEKVDDFIKLRLKAFNEEEKERKAQETTLSQYSEQLSRLKAETKGLNQKSLAKEAEAKQHDKEIVGLIQQAGKLDESLKPFTSLDADLKREQQKRDANRIGHEHYLGAKKLADDLGTREVRLTQLRSDHANAQKDLDSATAELLDAERDFVPSELKAAEADHQSKHDRATVLKENLEADKGNLKKEEKRFKEWQESCKEYERVLAEIGRCEAAMELTELARITLRDTASAVAQHLCTRIATRAQRVFNQINPEPIELSWNAEPHYSLHVTPGDRRFAMLSGGEQTKLALAMTLAMIEEFSGLRFCIFDEPTYGVDADSRHKLADAILQAQEKAGLDQLLLVSHDDAFEGKTEHAILLEKSAGGGTMVGSSQ